MRPILKKRDKNIRQIKSKNRTLKIRNQRKCRKKIYYFLSKKNEFKK